MILCEYGCGNEAKYFFKRVKKWCCSSNVSKCLKIKEKASKKMIGRTAWNKGLTNCYSDIVIEKMKKAKEGLYIGEANPMFGKEGYWKNKKRPEHSKIMKGSKGYWDGKKMHFSPHKLTIEKILIEYPLFSKVEEMRYNPEKPGKKEIQIHCKNHNCENSKEKSGWFTPNCSQIQARKNSLEIEGKDNAYFYCSEQCKNECPLYRLNTDPFKITNNISYTNSEYETFRKYVLERDSFICQFCGDNAIHVHHERPKKLEPFFSLDPDYAWSCCEKCHYEKGHQDECSTGNLSMVKCKELEND